MKKVILSLAAVFAFGFANAQEVKFGAKLGGNLSTASIDAPSVEGAAISVPDNKSLVGFHVGGFAEIKLNDKFSVQPELLFSMEGSKFESSSAGEMFGVPYSESTESTVKMNYLNIPVMAKYYATEKLFFVAGPQVGFLLSAKQDTDYTFTMGGTTESGSEDGVDVKDDFKSVNFSLGFGGGYYFTENIFAEARYNVGLSNIAEEVSEEGVTFEPEFKLSAFQISVGYKF